MPVRLFCALGIEGCLILSAILLSRPAPLTLPLLQIGVVQARDVESKKATVPWR